MFGFGKKKKEEEEGFEEEFPAKKKFRDLKAENKRTRKEPTKPWGKSERILILIVLGLTVIVSAVLGAIARGNIGIPKIVSPVGNLPSRSFSFDETFVFEKEPDRNCCEKPILNFKDLTSNLSGTYGFYLIRLDGSAEYGFNEEVTFKAASLIKVPTVVALYQEAEAGRLNLDGNYVLKESDKFEGAGSIINMPAGTVFTFRQLAKYALNQSDNTAFNIFEIYLGDRKIQEAIQGMGMTRTSIYDNTTSPKDIATLFGKIYRGEILSPENSEEILSFMEDTGFDDWLKAGIPTNIKISHKYGREAATVNDAGIIYATRPYVLAVLTKDIDETEADSIFSELSKAIYNFESEK